MVDEYVFDLGSAMVGHYGPEGSGVTLTETKFVCTWNLQGDAGRPQFVDEVRRNFGVTLPTVPNTTAHGFALTAFWLGPNSWLLISSDAAALVDFESRKDAVNAVGGALFDVSASRIAWTIAGPQAATVLAKGCPLDFHPRAFPEGACAQSMLGHINVLVYKRSSSPAFTVWVARSFARDVWHTLCVSAAPYGYDVLPARFL